ncbi:MAG: hypothetical protein KCHDKBKB_01550 [Elusimicrobia bacterium]|nr:hypothetical protein [Elusimicrobiota bacterium]
MTSFEHEQREAQLLSDYLDLLNAGTAPSVEDYVAANGEKSKELGALIMALTAARNYLAHGQYPPLSSEVSARLFSKVEEQLASLKPLENLSENLRSFLDQREDILILLLHFMNQVWGRTKLVKLLFLLGKEGECDSLIDNFYGHYAYNFGAFDENVPKDVDHLESRNILRKLHPNSNRDGNCELGVPNEKKVETVYELTDRGKTIARKIADAVTAEKPEIIEKIKKIVDTYGRMSTDQLMDYTYNKYEETTTRSLVREKYLRRPYGSNNGSQGGHDAEK